MRTYRRLELRLSEADERDLRKLLRSGVQKVRVALRALVLLELSSGRSAPLVARNLELTPKAVRDIGWRYREGGLERALHERQRPGATPLLSTAERQRIIAMVCSDPPEGLTRWTVRLVAEEAVKRKLVPRVGRETVRVLLESHDLKPWRKRNLVRGLDRRRVHREDRRRSDGIPLYDSLHT